MELSFDICIISVISHLINHSVFITPNKAAVEYKNKVPVQ